MDKKNEIVNITKTFLPPIKSYFKYIEKIWDSNQLTNQGPLLKQFETKLKKYLHVRHLHFVTNGTLALQLSIKALGIEDGEIITTPFSHVATTLSILWERCKPVFVDIEMDSFCIDADKIEKKITKKTKAILAVHIFGFPCNVEKIEAIAKKHGLKVIYDGAHAFGVKYKGKFLLDHGDISICSFHATKIFHTAEGGCIIPRSKKNDEELEIKKKSGYRGDNHCGLGTNAKASEFQAAMGLCNLEYVDEIIGSRKRIFDLYDKLLGDTFARPKFAQGLEYNYSNYPIVFDSENEMKKAISKLNKENIFPKRYFYPSLNTLSYLKKRQKCPNSEYLSSRVLCLPLFGDLKKSKVERICKVVKGCRNQDN